MAKLKPLTDEQWGAKVRQMEQRTRGVSAYVIINPTVAGDARRYGIVSGRVVITAGSGGRVTAVAWLPDNPADRTERPRHYRYADGYGYDKHSAAMFGGRYWNLKTCAWSVLHDAGRNWNHQLEDAGYIVAQAV